MAMLEPVVVHWNALYAFEDGRMPDALDLVHRTKAHVVGISETIRHGVYGEDFVFSENTGYVGSPDEVLLTDANAMLYPDDPKSRLPHYVGLTIGRLPMTDFYDESKPAKRKLGQAVRVGRMGLGLALRELTDPDPSQLHHVYHTADPTYQPTIGGGRMAYTIDYIFGSQKVVFEEVAILDPRLGPSGQGPSDHKLVKAKIKR